MTISTATISGTLVLPDDTALSTIDRIEFTLTSFETEDATILPEIISADVDENGDFSIDIWPNETGVRGTQYQVFVIVSVNSGQYERRVSLGNISVPAATTYELDDLLGITPAQLPAVNADAAESAELAYRWANEDEDVDVADGEKSAKHHAAKAAGSAAVAATIVDGLGTLTAAVDDAETARDAALTAQAASETAQGLSEDARDLSETYANIVSRASSVASLTDPTTLTAGDLGIVSGSGDADVDGLYVVEANAPNEWVRSGPTQLSNTVGELANFETHDRLSGALITFFEQKLAELQGQVAALQSSNRTILAGSTEVVDVILVIGQSNAEGRGDSGSSPDATASGLYWNGTDFDTLADPVGGADTGSMWPAFANAWYARTGRRVVIVEQATGGADLTNGGDWSASGSLRAPAVTAANACLSYISGSGSYELGNVHAVWEQGQADGEAWDGTTITGDDYRDELITLATYLTTNITPLEVLSVIQLGLRGYGGGTFADASEQFGEGYEAIRKGQYDAATSSSLVEIVYEGAAGYLSIEQMSDGLHYDQSALNKMGPAAAYRMCGGSKPEVLVAPFVNATAFNDTAGNKSSRTVSHTIKPGSDGVVVVCSGMRGGGYTFSATIGGADALIIGRETGGEAGDGASKTVMVEMFYLPASDIPGFAWGRSVDVVVTATATQNAIHVATMDVRGVDRVGGFNGGFDVSSTSYGVSLHAPIDGLAIVASAITSATTTEISGSISNVTEVADMSVVNTAATRLVVGYAQVSDGDALTFTTTAGASADTIVSVATLLRPLIDGEW